MTGMLPRLFVTGALAICACGGLPGARAHPGASPQGHRYQPPPVLDDGWTVADARTLGLPSDPLEAMTEAIRTAVDYRDIHAVLIVKDGALVYEQYFAGADRHGRIGDLGHVEFGPGMRHDVRSVTKSVVSTLVGIAAASGAIPSLDQPIIDFFPEHADLATPERRAITIRHALTMSAGVAWNEWGAGHDSINTAVQMNRSVDLIRFVLERPVTAPAGSRWSYNGGLTQLLGEVVQRATGRSLLEFADATLFAPMAITDVEWYSNQGRSTPDTDSGLRLRPRDLAKFGLLFDQRGQWNGRQLIPSAWVDEAWHRRVAPPDSLVELGEDAFAEVGYGYQWFHAQYHLPYGQVTAHRAVGAGGQLVFIVPALRLVVVVNAGRYGDADDSNRLVLERVLPWALGAPESTYQFYERPTQPVRANDWPEVTLTATQRRSYTGSYKQDGVRVDIREEAGLIRIESFPGLEGGTVHLVPLGNHEFAFGLYEAGRLTKIYWADGRIEFQMSGDRAIGYIDRSAAGHVFGTAERVR